MTAPHFRYREIGTTTIQDTEEEPYRPAFAGAGAGGVVRVDPSPEVAAVQRQLTDALAENELLRHRIATLEGEIATAEIDRMDRLAERTLEEK